MLSLNGLVITMSCPGGSVVTLLRTTRRARPRSSASRVSTTRRPSFEGGSGDFVGTTNANLSNSVSSGSGSAYYVRANGTGVTALYGWREDALGGTSACRVFGQAIGG